MDCREIITLIKRLRNKQFVRHKTRTHTRKLLRQFYVKTLGTDNNTHIARHGDASWKAHEKNELLDFVNACNAHVLSAF